MSDESFLRTFYDISIGCEVREFQRRTLYGKVRQMPWLFVIALGSILWIPILLTYAVVEWLAKHEPAVYKDR